MNKPTTKTPAELSAEMLELTLLEVSENLERVAIAAEQRGSTTGAEWEVKYPTIHGTQTMTVKRTK